jgi:hypothetical protein
MFIDTAANVQELSAATERIADTAGLLIVMFVHTNPKEEKCCEVDVCPGQKFQVARPRSNIELWNGFQKMRGMKRMERLLRWTILSHF